MAQAAPKKRARRAPRRPPPVYTVELVPPDQQDPKVARAVLAWLIARASE